MASLADVNAPSNPSGSHQNGNWDAMTHYTFPEATAIRSDCQ